MEAPRPRTWLALALALGGAAAGLAVWLGVTARTGQYRAYLAALIALGAALGVRLVLRGPRAQAIALAVTLAAIAVGQYVAIGLLWQAAARNAGQPPGPIVVAPGRFLEGWRRLADPGREAVFLAVSITTVLWLLRRRAGGRPAA